MSISGLGVEGGIPHDYLVAHEGGEAFNQRLKQLQDAKKSHEAALADLNVGKVAKDAYKQAYTQFAESKKVLDEAKLSASQIVPNARKEAASIIASAEAEASKIRNDAMAELVKAKAEAARILSDAHVQSSMKQSAAIQGETARLNGMIDEAKKTKEYHDSIISRIKAAIE